MADPVARLDAALADRYVVERLIRSGGIPTVYVMLLVGAESLRGRRNHGVARVQ